MVGGTLNLMNFALFLPFSPFFVPFSVLPITLFCPKYRKAKDEKDEKKGGGESKIKDLEKKLAGTLSGILIILIYISVKTCELCCYG